MTNEERDLIARYVARVGGAPQQGGFLPGASGSVPQSQAALPPIDREADQFIAQQFQQYPEARYRITQTALVQEAALAEMTNRVNRLQWELEQAHNAMQQQGAGAQQQQPQQSRGFFGNLFGGGQQQQQPPRGGAWGGQQGYAPQYQPTSAPPQPQYPPNYQPGMFQRSGSGFLGSALTTAAGVAGGLVVGNALMNAFGGHEGGGGGFLGGAGGAAAAGGPWGGADPTGGAFDGAGTVPVSDPASGFPTDQGGGADPFGGAGNDGGFQNTGFDQGGGGDPFGGSGGFDQGGGGDPFGGGGGFDSGGGGFDNT